jgi:hypothetical protein
MAKQQSPPADQQDQQKRGAGSAGAPSNGGAETDLIEQAQEVTEQVQETAVHLADTVRQQVTAQVEKQAGRLAGELETVSLALQTAASQVRQQDNQLVAQYVDKAAARIGGFSDSLRGPDVPQKVDQIARQRPGLFLGGALGLGLLASRFFKTSSRNQARRDQERAQREQLRQERLREAEEARLAQESSSTEQLPGGDLGAAYPDDALLTGMGAGTAAAAMPAAPGYVADESGGAVGELLPVDTLEPIGFDVDSGVAVEYAESDEIDGPASDPSGERR